MKPKDTEQLEKVVLALSLGICVALENKAITIDEAEHLLFSPCTLDVLEKIGVHKDIVGLIHDGTELEDVARIVPEHFGEHFLTMKKDALRLLKQLPSCDMSQVKWIERFSLTER